jgi:hypothetical protein
MVMKGESEENEREDWLVFAHQALLRVSTSLRGQSWRSVESTNGGGSDRGVENIPGGD